MMMLGFDQEFLKQYREQRMREMMATLKHNRSVLKWHIAFKSLKMFLFGSTRYPFFFRVVHALKHLQLVLISE